MNNTGIIRKIDELGRIVIPKEIRNHLNIKTSDSIEIFLDQDKIILKKYSMIRKSLENINKYFKIIELISDDIYILIDKEKIVKTTKGYENYQDKNISNEIFEIIKERKQIINNELKEINISNELIYQGKYIITPIIIDADLIGAVICFSKSEVNQTVINTNNILMYLIKNEY